MRTVVWGAPCSGKSTYVREHAKAGDLICDYDTLYQAVSGLPKNERIAGLETSMLEMVSDVYQLIENHPELDAWIITAARDKAKAEELAKRFDAELVALDVSREEAHKRCDEDDRPDFWHSLIDQWFDAMAKSSKGQSAKKLFIEIQRLKEWQS